MDQYSVLNRADKVELKRLSTTRVGYMEIRTRARGFGCGDCVFLEDLFDDDTYTFAYCTNKYVRSPVSPLHGCCNLFKPSEEEQVFP